MAGTIPTVVYYGLGLLSPTWFYPATAIVCASSDSPSAARGRRRRRSGAFVALAPLVGADPVIAAGAVISGAYFGDKMTPVRRRPSWSRRWSAGSRPRSTSGRWSGRRGRPSSSPSSCSRSRLMTPVTGPGFDPAAAQATLASSSRSRCSTSRRWSCSSSCRSGACHRSWRSSAAPSSPACCRGSPSRSSSRRSSASRTRDRCLGHRGALRRAGERVRVDDRQRDDRRALLARRDGRRC